ncbi:HYC_CC_PP family protein [Mariniflexile fucanivorans]|uniref:HYC_CC_PP family protein n=1 Tax=Mariniflexile fucanivorans TaxID=264023 RepID=UPI003F4AA876
MIKRFLHKSFSVLLALLVLFSTVSFTIEKHYCGDVLVDVALFTEAQKCDMGTSGMAQEAITKNTCCKDEVKLVKGQDELKVSTFDDLNFQQQLFITTSAYAFVNLFEGLAKQVSPHKDYSPPNLVADIQVLDQVFII